MVGQWSWNVAPSGTARLYFDFLSAQGKAHETEEVLAADLAVPVGLCAS